MNVSSLVVFPSPLSGTVEVPGDKSISHRAVLFGALAEGTTRIRNLLEGEDVLRTVAAMKAMGVSIQKKKNIWIIRGVGLDGLCAPRRVLDCGNSGTTLRLLTGLLSAYPFKTFLTGDRSLNARPMKRVFEPLRLGGATVGEFCKKGARMVVVEGGGFCGGKFKISVASAQLKTALLLAGLASRLPVSVTEPSLSRDHTERMLRAFGVKVTRRNLTVEVPPVRRLKALSIVVPGDFSSAAFFIVAGLIHQNQKSVLRLRHVGVNPTRTGALDVLKKMGGRIRLVNRRTIGGEPVADLIIRPSSLKGVTIGGSLIPRLIDEVPILAVAAAFARGTTVIKDAGELRVKETDRIHALAVELSRFGVKIRESKDGLVIIGRRGDRGRVFKTHGKVIGHSHGDHRMAMSLAVLGTTFGMVWGSPQKPVIIKDTDCIRTSFPGFVRLLTKAGGKCKSL